MKSFFVPSPLKIILAFGLFIVCTWVVHFFQSIVMFDYSTWGIPLTFFEVWGPCRPGMDCSAFNGIALAGDLAIWYAVSTVIIMWFKSRQRARTPQA